MGDNIERVRRNNNLNSFLTNYANYDARSLNVKERSNLSSGEVVGHTYINLDTNEMKFVHVKDMTPEQLKELGLDSRL